MNKRAAAIIVAATLFLIVVRFRSGAGIGLTESFATTPGPSVSGLYFGHPQARYFSVGRLGRDQVHDYAERKGMTLAEAERWLRQNLAYEP